MSRCEEPVVVAIRPWLPEPRQVVVADAVIVVAETHTEPDPSGGLFDRYPGLTLVVQTHPSGGVIVRCRDGVTFAFPLNRARPLARDAATAAADLIRARWAAVVYLMCFRRARRCRHRSARAGAPRARLVVSPAR